MNIIKKKGLGYLIPIDRFNICLLDNKTRKWILEEYKKEDVTTHKSCYYLQKFEHHLKIFFNISLKEYCIKYLNIEWPKCPLNGKEVGYKISGEGINVSEYNTSVTKEHSEKFRKSCERMSKERIGAGNPMYGIPAWNRGLDITDPRVKSMGDAHRGIPLTLEHRQKLKDARAASPLKARHTQPHSPETCKILRLNTAKLWATGVFNRNTSIHLKMREFLNTLNLKEQFTEEFQVWYFSMDFAFPNSKIAIECQGTYFHIDPRIYPNGPIDAIQRRNFGRDKAKRKICCDREGWKIIEIWETEINDGTFKEFLITKLKEYNLINNNETIIN